MNTDTVFDMYTRVLLEGFSPNLMIAAWKDAKEWGWPVDNLDPRLGVWANRPNDGGPTRFGSVDGEGNFYEPIPETK